MDDRCLCVEEEGRVRRERRRDSRNSLTIYISHCSFISPSVLMNSWCSSMSRPMASLLLCADGWLGLAQ